MSDFSRRPNSRRPAVFDQLPVIVSHQVVIDEIDEIDLDDLRASLAEVVEAARPPLHANREVIVILDLAAVRFLCVAGATVIADLAAVFGEAGHVVVATNTCRTVEIVLRLAAPQVTDA